MTSITNTANAATDTEAEVIALRRAVEVLADALSLSVASECSAEDEMHRAVGRLRRERLVSPAIAEVCQYLHYIAGVDVTAPGYREEDEEEANLRWHGAIGASKGARELRGVRS